MLGIFIFEGAWTLIQMILAKKECTEYIEAVIVDIIISHGRHGSSVYPVFGYSFDGVDYRSKCNFSSSRRISKGDTVELYIDPENPEKFYWPKQTIHKIIFCVMFIGFGIAVLCKFN